MGAELAIPLFPTDEIPRILDTVMSCAGTLHKRHETEREDEITNRLHKLLRKAFRSAPFIPAREHSVFDDSDKEGPSGRIDINFICLPGDETYFAIEAKRLHVTFPSGWQSLIGEYTGEQGMMCFVSGKYAPFQRAAAMLGYVFDGDVAKASAGVSASVAKNAGRLRLAPPHRLQKSTILPGKELDETHHNLDSKEFTIYHQLVSV